MREKEFYKELFGLAVPIGLQNLLTALVGASDALMLGRLSQDAISAVSLANQISFLMMLFYGAILGGGGALLAQYWGKGDKNMGKNIFAMMMKWTIAVELIFFAAAMMMPNSLMRIFTPDPELIRMGASYLRIVGFSYLFAGISQCYFVVMKLEGKASKSLMISIVTLAADMLLDFFLIYGIAGAPKLGANGSAYSTVCVELLALMYCIAESYRKDSTHPAYVNFTWHSREIFGDFCKIALPMLSSSLAWGLSISMHSFIMGHMGSDATAAASISSIALEIVTCVCKGVSAGAGIMLGKILGQDLFDKAKSYGRKLSRMSFAIGGIHALLLAAVGPLMVRFFVLSDQARHYLIYMLLFMGLYVMAYSINTIVVCGIFPAGGDAMYDAKSVFFATWCFAIPLSLLALFVFQWPVMYVYMLMCADEIIKLPWVFPRYRKYIWVKNLTREAEGEAL